MLTVAVLALGGPGGDIMLGGAGIAGNGPILLMVLGAIPPGWLLTAQEPSAGQTNGVRRCPAAGFSRRSRPSRARLAVLSVSAFWLAWGLGCLARPSACPWPVRFAVGLSALSDLSALRRSFRACPSCRRACRYRPHRHGLRGGVRCGCRIARRVLAGSRGGGRGGRLERGPLGCSTAGARRRRRLSLPGRPWAPSW